MYIKYNYKKKHNKNTTIQSDKGKTRLHTINVRIRPRRHSRRVPTTAVPTAIPAAAAAIVAESTRTVPIPVPRGNIGSVGALSYDQLRNFCARGWSCDYRRSRSRSGARARSCSCSRSHWCFVRRFGRMRGKARVGMRIEMRA